MNSQNWAPQSAAAVESSLNRPGARQPGADHAVPGGQVYSSRRYGNRPSGKPDFDGLIGPAAEQVPDLIDVQRQSERTISAVHPRQRRLPAAGGPLRKISIGALSGYGTRYKGRTRYIEPLSTNAGTSSKGERRCSPRSLPTTGARPRRGCRRPEL